MVGFRNIMCEMGLEQEEATTIYQDNEAAISIAMNRVSEYRCYGLTTL